MSLGLLHGKHGNPRFAKVMIAAKISGVQLDQPSEFLMGQSNRKPEYLEKFPLGQVPGLVLKDGKTLTESSAIAQYVAEQKKDNPILGKDAWERAEIQKYVLLSEAQLMPQSLVVLYMIFGYKPKDAAIAEEAYKKLKELWGELDRQIQSKDYLVGDRLTLADIDIVSILVCSYKFLLYPEIIGNYPNLNRYFKNIITTPEFSQHFEKISGEADYCKAPLSFE